MIVHQQMKRNVPYSAAVGALLHAAIYSRPDIAFATSVLTRFNSNPGQAHWNGVKRVLRYLKATASLALALGGSSDDPQLLAYSDADWAGDQDDRRSTTGCMVLFGNGIVAWQSKKQATVAMSTMEAE